MDIDASRAQRLFQAVVTQALIDAVHTPVLGKDAPRFHQQMKERNAARNWLLHDDEAFPEIVSLAGYNPDDIRERAVALAKRGWPSVKHQIDAEAA